MNTLILIPFIGFALIAIGMAAMAFALSLKKKSMVSQSISVSRMTQDGETVVIHGNFFEDESYESKRSKMMELAQLGDDRLKFCDDRFKALIAEQKAKQAALSKVE